VEKENTGMNPAVAECLNKLQAETERLEKERENAEEKKRRAEEKKERKRILIQAGLYTEGPVEVKSGRAYDYVEVIDGVSHYYRENQKIPMQVTDEEFAAVRAALEKWEDVSAGEEAEREMDDESEADREQKSWAESFFSVIGILAWIAGVIWLIVMLATETFDFSMLLLCFMSGAVCMCASELFGWLVKIHRKLSDIADSLKKD